ncbi:MAG: hypothetical protein QOG66_1377 [Methylobacteriaceae bacterium]|jgi:hypothetical protein|nr:hypothetical protein [Methylobacteriaceae bacterium]
MQAQKPNPGGEVPPPSPAVIPDPDPSPYPVDAPGDEPVPPLRDPDVIDPGAPVPNPTNPPKPSF